MPTRIKICGLTRADDVQAAIDCGADALGFVFYDRSPRHVTLAQAEKLLVRVPPLVSAVGLFVDAPADTVRATLAAVPLDQLQFHGAESADYCRQFGRRWFKAVPMRDLPSAEAAAAWLAAYPDSSAFLFDAFGKAQMGGSGEVFDWSRLPPTDRPVILAGGLHAGNVGDAIRRFRPFAV
ncbi:MAG: phosphoribosylanthranilate isomerase, partial [Cardiobacterium sp.]